MSTNKARRIIVITTGGTIEKTYDESDGSLENRGTIISQKLSALLRLPNTELEIKPLMSKDSLYMDDADRTLIAEAIAKCQEENYPIVVLHGTDTMDKTGLFCYEHIKKVKVPVVFTGAMKPIGFVDSDAVQNVTEALIVAKILPPGLYVSFHNCVFPAHRIRKNRSKNTFEEIL